MKKNILLFLLFFIIFDAQAINCSHEEDKDYENFHKDAIESYKKTREYEKEAAENYKKAAENAKKYETSLHLIKENMKKAEFYSKGEISNKSEAYAELVKEFGEKKAEVFIEVAMGIGKKIESYLKLVKENIKEADTYELLAKENMKKTVAYGELTKEYIKKTNIYLNIEKLWLQTKEDTKQTINHFKKAKIWKSFYQKAAKYYEEAGDLDKAKEMKNRKNKFFKV